jgi:ABC-2 type transport system permease protein
MTVAVVAATLPTTEYGFMVSLGGVAQVLAASFFAAAAGAVLGAGIGALVRNTGGAVATVVIGLFIAPPLVIQLVSEAASWVPGTIANVAAGVDDSLGVPAALAAIAAWAIVPAAAGLWAVQRRDVI